MGLRGECLSVPFASLEFYRATPEQPLPCALGHYVKELGYPVNPRPPVTPPRV